MAFEKIKINGSSKLYRKFTGGGLVILFKNAKFVLTDSCHGASFALIFRKNLLRLQIKLGDFRDFNH